MKNQRGLDTYLPIHPSTSQGNGRESIHLVPTSTSSRVKGYIDLLTPVTLGKNSFESLDYKVNWVSDLDLMAIHNLSARLTLPDILSNTTTSDSSSGFLGSVPTENTAITTSHRELLDRDTILGLALRALEAPRSVRNDLLNGIIAMCRADRQENHTETSSVSSIPPSISESSTPFDARNNQSHSPRHQRPSPILVPKKANSNPKYGGSKATHNPPKSKSSSSCKDLDFKHAYRDSEPRLKFALLL